MTTNVKQQAIELIERLPQDASIEEVMEELYFLTKVRRGLSQIEAGQVVSHEEVKRRLGR
jgi:predicted transcriptional regulator